MITNSVIALKDGNPIILCDDGAPIPCAYLVTSADFIDEDKLRLLINGGRGIILVPLYEDLCKEKGLSSLTSDSKHPFPLTLGVEAREGVGSGISLSDRTKTIKAILSSTNSFRSIVAPGHIYPLPARTEGLLVKSGIAEAVCDILKIAGLSTVGAISHCLNSRGEFCNEEEIIELSATHKLPVVNLSSIVQYRLINEKLVKCIAEARLPTKEFGSFKAHCFVSKHDGAEHLVLSKGHISSSPAVLTRMHSEKKLADIFSLDRLPEKSKIDKSMAKIAKEGRGVLVYIKKANRNLISSQIETENQSAKELSENSNHDSKFSALREVGVGAQILKELGIENIKLLTMEKKVLNNLSAYGINIVEQVELS